MAEEEVGLRLALKNRHETVAGLDDVGDKLNRAGDEAARAGRKARFGAGGFLSLGKSGKIAGRAVLYGTGAATAGVIGLGIVLGKFTKDSVQGWEDHRKVAKQTGAVIRSTGSAANVTNREVGHLSDALERKTGVDGDVIQSGANMLLTFKNIRNEQGKGNKIFSQSLGVLNDMSAAMHTDASKSAIQLGKALNDPVKGISALSKVGVTFTDVQQKQIENFVKQGDVASAQKIILGELSSEFEGSAKAQMTMGDQVLVGYHQLQDTIGKAVLPLQHEFQQFLINDGIPAAQHYADVFTKDGVPAIEHYARLFVDKGIPAVKDFARGARPLAESILPAIGTGLHTAADAVKVLAPKIKSVFDGFNSLPGWAKEAIAIGAGGAVVGQKLGVWSKVFGSGSNGILGAVSEAKPLPVYVVNKGGIPGVPGKPTPVPGEPGGVPKPLAIGGTVLGLGLAAATLGGVVDAPGDKWYQNGMKAVDTKDVLSGAEAEKFLFDRRTKAFQEWFDAQTVGYAASSKALGHLISGTGQLDSTVGKAKTSTQQLADVLRGVDHDWTPKLTVDGLDTALSKLNSVRTTLLNLPALPGANSPDFHPGVSALPALPANPGKTGGGKGGDPRLAPPDLPKLGDDFWGDDAGDLGRPIHAHLHVDGREMADVMLNRLGEKVARR